MLRGAMVWRVSDGLEMIATKKERVEASTRQWTLEVKDESLEGPVVEKLDGGQEFPEEGIR